MEVPYNEKTKIIYETIAMMMKKYLVKEKEMYGEQITKDLEGK